MFTMDELKPFSCQVGNTCMQFCLDLFNKEIFLKIIDICNLIWKGLFNNN